MSGPDESEQGSCPICGGIDGLLSAGPAIWAICHAHKLRWYIGHDDRGLWRNQTRQQLFSSLKKINTYRGVEPGCPSPTTNLRILPPDDGLSSPISPELAKRHGVCPQCGSTDGILRVGRDSWGVCVAHQAKWFIGADMFSGSVDTRQSHENRLELDRYVKVQPDFPNATTEGSTVVPLKVRGAS